MKLALTPMAAALFCVAAHAANNASKDMPTVVPESIGVNSAPLVRMSEWPRAEQMDVRSLFVVKDGKIVFERYGDGLTRDNNYERPGLRRSSRSRGPISPRNSRTSRTSSCII